MPVLLPIHGGAFALVDEEDVPTLSKYRWRIQHRYYKGERLGPSAVVATTPDGIIKMHRLVMSAEDGELVDHINGLPLNNTKANLRVCSFAENLRNRKISRANRSGVKGVYRCSRSPEKSPRWRAEIQANGVKHHLGTFKTKAEAGRAYREAARRLHGEFARFA